ncbi:hypothetical protein KC19_10G059700 [Ceratodon purpureus]|uniref:Uncharacterized protein n=1 Tax=Ceratodon purpureus TaxID=3225 RepID=A0A8T0GHN2_CERPU|nr:hypothetical protein KC19_10G059700 [Ceratodon purpureus]
MQGYKGPQPQRHKLQGQAKGEGEGEVRGRGEQRVVKAVVDYQSRRAALLLADSSCVLVALGSGAAAITVPAPCTDACFLRLQAYGPAGAAGGGRGGSNGSGWCGSPARVGVGEIAQGESPTLRVQELRKGNGRGKGFGGGVRRELYVVTARPGKGGSCTDLRAWSCADPAFSAAEIELEPGDGRVRASGRAFARLDAPHGLAVKMAASINVLVVYSSSAGKFWVMAGKWSDQTGGPAQNVRAESMFGAEEYERRRLVLMKCAVVSCYGPVYSIHVSSLHLFLGESKGVRVWSLRPLIKPGSSGKSSGDSKSRLQGASEQASHQPSKKFDCESCGRGERCQHVMDSCSALGKMDEKKGAGNGAHLEENVDSRVSIGGTAMKKVSRKGLRTARESNTASMAGLGNYLNPKVGSGAYSRFSNFEFRSLSELQAVLKTDLSPENLPAEDEIEGTTTIENGGGGVIKNETHNGILRSYPAEHGDISIKETLTGPKLRDHTEGDSAASNAEVFRSHECNGDHTLKTTSRQRNGLTPVAESLLEAQILASHLAKKKPVLHQSAESVSATGSRVQNRKLMKESDFGGVWFAALSGEEEVITTQSSSHAGRRPCSQLQVVDIQGLGLKEYIVLDSKGELHLLTLNEVSEEQKSESPGRTYLTIRHLRSTLRVTSFAVLPLPPPLPQAHQDFLSPAAVTVKRKLWISDGMYSIHVVLLPEENIKAVTDTSSTDATLPVSQAVFMKDRIDGLVAGSPDTVVVLTKGRLVSYVIPGD